MPALDPESFLHVGDADKFGSRGAEELFHRVRDANWFGSQRTVRTWVSDGCRCVFRVSGRVMCR
jgi:hypothetical protein